MTKQEMIEALNIYFEPIFQMIGAALAVAIIWSAWYLVIWPFVRKIRY